MVKKSGVTMLVQRFSVGPPHDSSPCTANEGQYVIYRLQHSTLIYNQMQKSTICLLQIPVKVSSAYWQRHEESQQLHPTAYYEPDFVGYLCKGPKKIKRNIFFYLYKIKI